MSCLSDDNYAADGTADKAMRAIRPGGMYLMMPHVNCSSSFRLSLLGASRLAVAQGECYAKKMQAPPCISANPKPGVRQLNYNTGTAKTDHFWPVQSSARLTGPFA